MTWVFVNIFLQVDTKTLVLFGNDLVVEINLLKSKSDRFAIRWCFVWAEQDPTFRKREDFTYKENITWQQLDQ